MLETGATAGNSPTYVQSLTTSALSTLCCLKSSVYSGLSLKLYRKLVQGLSNIEHELGWGTEISDRLVLQTFLREMFMAIDSSNENVFQKNYNIVRFSFSLFYMCNFSLFSVCMCV